MKSVFTGLFELLIFILNVIAWPVKKLWELYVWMEVHNLEMEYKLGIKYKDMGYGVEGMKPELERLIRNEMEMKRDQEIRDDT